MDFQEKIRSILIGIRYSKSFRLRDVTGSIADYIVYSEDSPFDEGYFPEITSMSNGEKVLRNTETGDYFRVNESDVIFSKKVSSNFEAAFAELRDDVAPFLERLFGKFKIRDVRRLGIIFQHELEKPKKFEDAVKPLTDNLTGNVSGLAVKFAKKLPSQEALIRKNVNDYVNTIYNFEQAEELFSASYDYQVYFEPIVEDLRDCKIVEFLDASRASLDPRFYSILRKYEG